MTTLRIDLEPGDENVLVQQSPCGRDLLVVSQPGRLIEVRHKGRTVLLMQPKCEHGHEPWFAEAIERATTHALGQEGGS